MKLLILGGTGFVSGMLAEQAVREGREVWTVTRGLRSRRTDVHALTADRHSVPELKAALAGLRFDAAVDCICRSAEDALTDLEVLPAMTDRLVVISTDSVYHPAYKKVPQNEDGIYLTGDGYGADKRRMEEAFLTAETTVRWTVFRPGHIFGEGSLAGCFPEETRSRAIPGRIRAGEPMRLVGDGSYLLQPVYVRDLNDAILDCIPRPAAENRIFCIGGPDVVTNRRYYELLAELLGCPVHFESVPEEGYLAAHPEYSGHLCHRVYDLSALREAGIRVPQTSLRTGLRRQLQALGELPETEVPG